MGRVGLAFRSFFRILRDGGFAARVGPLYAAPAPPPAVAPPEPAPAPVEPPPARTRSDALNLLAALQREARFVDFVKEPIGAYDDAQIGAAVRDVHAGCAAALERMLALRPVLDQPEGGPADVPAGFDAARVRLTGNMSGPPPFRGALRHAGWQATKLDLPSWSGGDPAARVVAPAEVEVK